MISASAPSPSLAQASSSPAAAAAAVAPNRSRISASNASLRLNHCARARSANQNVRTSSGDVIAARYVTSLVGGRLVALEVEWTDRRVVGVRLAVLGRHLQPLAVLRHAEEPQVRGVRPALVALGAGADLLADLAPLLV